MSKNSGGTRSNSATSRFPQNNGISNVITKISALHPTFIDKDNDGDTEAAKKIIDDAVSRLSSINSMIPNVDMSNERNKIHLQSILDRVANDIDRQANYLAKRITVFSGDKYGMRKTQAQDYDNVLDFRDNIKAQAEKLRKVFR